MQAGKDIPAFTSRLEAVVSRAVEIGEENKTAFFSMTADVIDQQVAVDAVLNPIQFFGVGETVTISSPNFQVSLKRGVSKILRESSYAQTVFLGLALRIKGFRPIGKRVSRASRQNLHLVTRVNQSAGQTVAINFGAAAAAAKPGRDECDLIFHEHRSLTGRAGGIKRQVYPAPFSFERIKK